MILKKQLLNILPLVIIVSGLFAYSFMNAEWNPPTAPPPGNNARAPINIGTSTESIQNGSGDLVFNRFAAKNAVWSPEYCDENGEDCLSIDQMGSGGGNSNSTTITVGGRCFEPAAAVSCMWNWSGDGNDTAMFVTYDLVSPQSACQGNHRNFVSYKIILAQCQSSYTYTYSWSSGSWGSCQSVNYANCDPRGTQSRTVSCKRSDGVTVASTFCTGTKPATSQSCSAYLGSSCR